MVLWRRICLPVWVTQGPWLRSLGREDPLEQEMATHSRVLAWKIHGQGKLEGSSPWGRKELDTTKHTHTHTPEDLIAPDSSAATF